MRYDLVARPTQSVAYYPSTRGFDAAMGQSNWNAEVVSEPFWRVLGIFNAQQDTMPGQMLVNATKTSKLTVAITTTNPTDRYAHVPAHSIACFTLSVLFLPPCSFTEHGVIQ